MAVSPRDPSTPSVPIHPQGMRCFGTDEKPPPPTASLSRSSLVSKYKTLPPEFTEVDRRDGDDDEDAVEVSGAAWLPRPLTIMHPLPT